MTDDNYSKIVEKLAAIAQDYDLAEIKINHDIKNSQLDLKIIRKREQNVVGSSVQTVASSNIPVNSTTAPATTVDVQINQNEDILKNSISIISPMVGVVYTSPDPDSPDYTKIGSTINVGDTVLLMEAMKVFTPVKSDKSGIIKQILVKSGQAVEFGQPLIILE
jgi:acetyl-CoA carboxylase biotin carboxyl carrier protein